MKVSSLDDSFKFIQFRGIAAVSSPKAPEIDLRSFRATSLARDLVGKSNEQRRDRAKVFLGSDACAIKDVGKLSHGAAVLGARDRAVAACGSTVADFVADLRVAGKLDLSSRSFVRDLDRLSDTLLALTLTAPTDPTYAPIEGAYLAYTIAGGADATSLDMLPLRSLLSLPLSEFFVHWPAPASGLLRPPPWGRSVPIRSVGIADLLVVKQHIARYEATEIAHIENVMTGETRARTHRFLERFEETVTLEREITDTKQRELETSERFELNKEASQTIHEEQKYGFDLSVSAKYGPTVDVRSAFEFDSEQSREAASKASSNFAKSITDRSLQRVEQRVREERIRKLVRETEETNRHEFTNGPGEHVVGIYQFVDKVYAAQVFNYGKREMFDLFVPEPASFLWYLEKNPAPDVGATEIPTAPAPLAITPSDIASTRGAGVYYADLVARYGATGVSAPKDATVEVSASITFPAGTDGGPGIGTLVGDSGSPMLTDSLDLKIPAGYRPVSARFSAIAHSDSPDAIELHYSFERLHGVWLGRNWPSVHPRIRTGVDEIDLSGLHGYASEAEGGMSVNVVGWDVSQWAITVHVTCVLTDEEHQRWQLSTYDTLQSAYLDRLKDWQSEVDRIKAAVAGRQAERQAPVGVPPTERQNTIINELKKHCISIFTGYWYDHPSVMVRPAGAPPTFDLERSEQYARAVQFFEQAFEWHQIQYAFYPYYWASKESWQERFCRTDPDYVYQQFLQAGAARVLVPVRPGFEHAVNRYLEGDHAIWDGRGAPGDLHDPTYVSIVDQIKEQSGEELDEPIPVGQPWEIRMPTSLIMLKRDAELPHWRRLDEAGWRWVPAEGDG